MTAKKDSKNSSDSPTPAEPKDSATVRYPDLNAPLFKKSEKERSGGAHTQPHADDVPPPPGRDVPESLALKKSERERSGGAHLQVNKYEYPKLPQDATPPTHYDPRQPAHLQKTVDDQHL